MSVLTSTVRVSGVKFVGLDKVILPFTAHVLEGFDDSVYDTPSFNSLADNDDKYFVKAIDGLQPPARNVAIARTAAGGKFKGVTVEDRQIVVTIGLNPDWDAGETPKILRDNLYTMIYTGYNPAVDIVLMAGPFPVYHEIGYVSNFDEARFDKDPVVQITFDMLNPTFRGYSKTTYAPSDLSETNPDIYNFGTAETGFQFAVKFTDTKNGWSIKQAENQKIGMHFDKVFEDGDVLSVSTIPGQKYVHWKKHRGKVHNMLKILTSDSEWIQLHPGHNHFVVPAKTGKWDWNGNLSFTAHYAGA